AFTATAGLLIAALGTTAQSQTPAGGWTQRAPMPAVRGEVAAATGGNKLFALGGGAAGDGGGREREDEDPAAPARAGRAAARRHATISGSLHTTAKSTPSAGLRPRCTKGRAMWRSHMILRTIAGRRSRR